MFHHRLDLEYDLQKNYNPAKRPQMDSRLVATNQNNLLMNLHRAWRNLLNSIDDSLRSFGASAGGMQVNY